MWDLIVSVPDHCLSFYLVINSITVNNFASLFNCSRWVRQTQWWPRHKNIYFIVWGRSFLSVAWPIGVQLLVFFCSRFPVVLFNTPGISMCWSQHAVSVKSSSLFHHSIYLWFICFTWWSIDELESLHADRTTVCFEPWQKPRARLGSRKTCLSHPSNFLLTIPRRCFCCGSYLFVIITCIMFACCMTLWPFKDCPHCPLHCTLFCLS